MQIFKLEVTNIITTRTINRGLHHQGIPASTKLTETIDNLEYMLKPIRLQISLMRAQNSPQAINIPIL